MDIYIGNSIDEIKENNYKYDFVIVTIELYEFIVLLCEELSIDTRKLYIEPYGATEIPSEEVAGFINIFKEVLDSESIEFYADKWRDEPKFRGIFEGIDFDYNGLNEEEAILSIKNTIKMGEYAIKQGKGLVSIGE